MQIRCISINKTYDGKCQVGGNDADHMIVRRNASMTFFMADSVKCEQEENKCN